jgi:hypothetical protein
LYVGTALLVVAAVPFLVNTWENERVVVWFTVGSFVAAILLESYLSQVRHRNIPLDDSQDQPVR